ncbi:MAG: hypothetical protein K5756_07580 [Clostridiales bacterium]|nr:hypothetical protein [Clostridiales bacterium]
MLKLLIKKQLAEVFRNYFYNPKKNEMRSKGSVIAWFVFFVLIMVGMLGGMFTFLAVTLCKPLSLEGIDWLYFTIMSGLAIVFGAFGSVFNTFSGLYLSKDNDLLLSLPIPIKYIIISRLMNVYLLGTMYSATVMLPTLIVYWVIAGITLSSVICGLLLFITVTAIVMILSCVLGWVVAKISQKIKTKSFITVAASLAFIAAYYFVYFKAQTLIRNLIANAQIYGDKIKGSAYWLYLFGRMGEGSFGATAIFVCASAVLLAIVWFVLTRSFLSIATSSGKVEKIKYVEKSVKEKSSFGALLGKEFAKFTSSPNYMLNCGLGVLFIPVFGVLMLIKGRELLPILNDVFAQKAGSVCVLVCAMLCAISSMNDMAAPSVSLEGKNLWIAKVLPIEPKTVLYSKLSMHLILTMIPMIFSIICAAIVLEASSVDKLLICAIALLFVLFSSAGNLAVGLKMPNLTWTNELVPIKQSGAVLIAMFGSWAIVAVFAGLYLLIGYKIGSTPFLGIWAALLAAGSALLLRWLKTKGSRTFAEL